MAENQLRPFAHGDDANVTPYSDWTSAEYANLLENGFQSGIAKSDEVNRAVAQGANAAYAVGELIKDYAEENATLKPAPLYTNFKKALEQFVKRQVIGFIYPVGSVYVSTVSTNPAQLFGVGTWVRIGEGRGLIDAGANFTPGSTGGSDTHTITANEMPSHSHTATASNVGDHTHGLSVSSNGAHSHTSSVSENGTHSHSTTVSTNGNHTHTRGSMNITGSLSGNSVVDAGGFNEQVGALYDNGARGQWNAQHASNSNTHAIGFDASRSWTGETSTNGNHSHSVTVDNAGNHSHAVDIGSVANHTHTVSMNGAGSHSHAISVSATGGGQAFSVRNPYFACYMWRRVA